MRESIKYLHTKDILKKCLGTQDPSVMEC